MANVNVNTTELMRLLDVMPASHNLLLVGNHGIGKSQILTEYFESKGMKVVPLFLGQMADPGDLIGLPQKDEKTGRTTFMPPYWWDDKTPICLFLDELNRARPEMLQTVMDLALNRKLAGKSLPEGSRLISAVNYGDQYTLTDLDPALVSRFNIVTFKPTVQEWLLWARKAEVDSRVIDFIQENAAWLDKDPDAKEGADTGIDKTPDRRAWVRVSDILKGGEDVLSPVLTKIIASIVGAKAASAFFSSISNRKLVSGRDVVENFDRVAKTLAGYELHDLSVVNDGIYRFLEVEKIPEKNRDKSVKNLEAYFKFLVDNKKEAAAHWANLYVQQTYPNAVAFMARNCRQLTMSLVMYVQSIR